MGEDEEVQSRQMPMSDLELVMLTTDPLWGSPDLNKELKDKIVKVVKRKIDKGTLVHDKAGKPVPLGADAWVVEKQELWNILGFYSRDDRLGNLNDKEIDYCTHYLDLANDFLHVNMIRPFLICLGRCATKLELSQSRNGFLRRRQGTFTKENINRDMDTTKGTSLLFGRKKE
jgi:hypothetical protein